MKALTLLLAVAAFSAHAETTTVTTTEKSTPVTCNQEGDKMVCSKTVITAVTTTITAPVPRNRRNKPKEGTEA
jgi:hypothetical protein